jgi:hypothetical protein
MISLNTPSRLWRMTLLGLLGLTLGALPLETANASSANSSSAPEISTSVTAFQSGSAHCREEAKLDFAKGESQLDLPFELPDHMVPGSLYLEADGVRVLELRENRLSTSSATQFENALDKPIELFLEDGSHLQGLLRRAGDPLQIERDGTLLLVPFSHVMRVELSMTKSEKSKPHAWVSYVTKRAGKRLVNFDYLMSGLDWSAEYRFLLNEDDGELELYSSLLLNNQTGRDFQEASLDLVAGNLRRESNHPDPMLMRNEDAMVAYSAPKMGLVESELSVFHQYHLGRPFSLESGQRSQITFHEAVTLPFKRVFVYDGRRGVMSEIHLQNTSPHSLPAGLVRFFEEDVREAWQIVGEVRMPHAASGSELVLSQGEAFDLKAERVVLKRSRGNRENRETEIEVEFRLENHSKRVATVKVREHVSGDTKVLSADLPWEFKSATELEMLVSLEPGQTREVRLHYRSR